MVIDTKEKSEARLKEIEKEEREQQAQYENDKKNHNFVMLYRDHMPELRWLMKRSGIASSILNFIFEHMDYNNALICSYQVFMDYFEISESTVTRAIKLLKECGFIDILRSGTSNVYIANHEIAWTSWNNQKKYCQFNGKVLISQSENKHHDYRSLSERFKKKQEIEDLRKNNVQANPCATCEKNKFLSEEKICNISFENSKEDENNGETNDTTSATD